MRSTRKALGLLLLLSAPARAVEVSLSLAGATQPGEHLQARVEAEPVVAGSPSGGAATASREAVPVPGTVQLELDPRLGWRLRALAPGYWGEERVLPGGKAQGLQALRLFPSGAIEAKVEKLAQVDPPSEVSLEFSLPEPQRAPAAGELRKGRSPCQEPAPGRLRCELPAGSWDLKISSPGRVPLYFWSQKLTRGQLLALGSLRLEPGASVAGRVVARDTGEGLAGCEVRAELPGARFATDAQGHARLEKLAPAGRSNARGFFQLPGVATGSYELVASCPGRSPARLAPVPVEQGLETRLTEALAAGYPAALEVLLLPPLDPLGEPWKLSLEPLAGKQAGSGPARKGTASEAGEWRVAGLSPGRYWLQVLGQGKDAWWSKDLLVGSEDQLETIQLDLVGVRGRLSRAGEPVSGQLWFSAREAMEQVHLVVGEDGRFGGLLPGAGTWHLDWTKSEEGSESLALEPVEVEKRRDGKATELELEIPDTRLRGRVEDEQGKPVPGAELTLTQPSKDFLRSSARADERGSFEVVGLATGNQVVSARRASDDAESDSVLVVVPKDGAGPEVVLVLRQKAEVAGLVRAAGRPLAGASVLAWLPLGGSAGSTFAKTVSGPDGRFSVTLPGSAPVVHFLVEAPGLSTSITTVAVRRGEPAVLDVETVAGTLRLDFGPSPRQEDLAAGFLIAGGTFVPLLGVPSLFHLGGPRREVSSTLEIPNLAPGDYALCQGPGVLGQLRQGAEPPAERCSRVTLAPFSVAVLTLPGR
ncbi:MAG: carboxypeptidase-like regulatory domain-containing protein [Thermoanaerobaculia bacterium]